MRSANINGFMVGFTGSIIFYAIAAAFSLGAYLIRENLFGTTFENIYIVLAVLTEGAQEVGKIITII